MVNTAIAILVHIAFLLTVIMIIAVARKFEKSPVLTAFIAALSVMTVWNVGTALEIDVRMATGETYMLASNICYIGICLAPVAVLYLGKTIQKPDFIPRPKHALFLLLPFISIIMVFTNPLHNLFFVNFSLYSSEAVYGAYFYIHSLYSYSCVAAGIAFMLIASTRNFGIFSMQSILVVLAVLITLIPNVLYSAGVGNLPFSISTIAFTVSLLVFAVAFRKYRFISALPITLKQIVNLISDGYLVVDKHLRILTHNQALLRMFPDPEGIAVGAYIRPLIEKKFYDASFEQFTEALLRAASKQETISIEARIGGGAYVSVEITPVIQHGSHTGSIILLKDVTESKLLIESSQVASRAKSDFLSYMSHEIRTPLNAILGMINIGLETNDADKKDYCFERAESASKHLLGIINDVLDISKIEADKFELSYSEFDLERMLMNITNVASIRAEEKHLNFVVDLKDNVPGYLGGDELRLSQVITNLLTNAVKFTPEKGSVILTIQAIKEEGDEVTLRVEVSDTGPGVSKEQQEKLFAPFTQADANITRKFGGTGLGLAISKRIVELMDGDIWVESEPGEGAKFIFTMKMKKITGKPRGKLDLDMQGGHEDRRGRPAKHVYDFYRHRILVAEDIDINREIISAVLEETQVSIDFAEDGQKAVAMFSAEPERYSLILMDINMPVMDGYEATRMIRALSPAHAKNIPIIAMTANVFREDVEKCLLSGMNDHTGKPVDTNALLGMLNKYLKNPGSGTKMKNIYELEQGIAWDDALLTGNAHVDMQRQKLFEKVGELVFAHENGKSAGKLCDVLEYLQNYTVRHFTDEEALMIEHDYYDCAYHKREHENFKAEVNNLAKRFKEGGPTEELSHDADKALVRWLVNHVQQEDKKFSEYMRSKSA